MSRLQYILKRPDKYLLVGVGTLDRLHTESGQVLAKSFSLPLYDIEKISSGDLSVLASGKRED